MTFEEMLPHLKNHEYIRRKDWEENNVVILSDDNETLCYFKMFKDAKLPIVGPYAIFPICEDDNWSKNEDFVFELPEIFADDWELLDETKLKKCGFLAKNLNKQTEHQLLALMAIKKMEEDFEKMSYDEKLELHEKYPDLVRIVD